MASGMIVENQFLGSMPKHVIVLALQHGDITGASSLRYRVQVLKEVVLLQSPLEGKEQGSRRESGKTCNRVEVRSERSNSWKM